MFTKELKIGGRSFIVKVEDLTSRWEADPETPEGFIWRGEVNLTAQEIFIHSSSKKEGMMKALLHEILEVIDDDYELKLPHQTITILESALYQVLKDNKLKF